VFFVKNQFALPHSSFKIHNIASLQFINIDVFPVPKNCAEVLKCGGKKNGVYSVDPDGKGAFKVTHIVLSHVPAEIYSFIHTIG